MRAGKTHVIGAGLAGLAAAVSLVRGGRAVTVHEAAGQAGGRCRSYLDAKLGCSIDNGNHLLLSGNTSVMRYLREIGAGDVLVGPASSCFPFLDLRTGQGWRLRPSAGVVPWWVFDPRRRVPGTRALDYLPGMRLAMAGRSDAVTDCVAASGVLFERFWEPLAVAVLNAPARAGAATLLRRVLRETFARGEAACRPRIARTGLSDAFIDPALEFLRRGGVEIRFGQRLRAIGCRGDTAVQMDFGDSTVELRDGDNLVLAVPPSAAAGLLPALRVPEQSNAIVNVHFRLPGPADFPADLPFLGLIGGTAQWLFVRNEIASVTVSAADALAAEPAAAIACKTWHDVVRALRLDGWELPAYSVVKERRATFAQTPEQVRRRPGPRCGIDNAYLAGDWIDTGLPATIEGAVRSGRMAAGAVLGR